MRETPNAGGGTRASGSPPEGTCSPPTRKVRHEYTHSLLPLLSQLGVSLLVSTYQAGKVVAVGVAGVRRPVNAKRPPTCSRSCTTSCEC